MQWLPIRGRLETLPGLRWWLHVSWFYDYLSLVFILPNGRQHCLRHNNHQGYRKAEAMESEMFVLRTIYLLCDSYCQFLGVVYQFYRIRINIFEFNKPFNFCRFHRFSQFGHFGQFYPFYRFSWFIDFVDFIDIISYIDFVNFVDIVKFVDFVNIVDIVNFIGCVILAFVAFVYFLIAVWGNFTIFVLLEC